MKNLIKKSENKILKVKNIISLVLVVFLYTNCTNQVDTTLNGNTNTNTFIYQNNFENKADLESWEGLNESSLDSVAYEGKKSLRIDGGCVQPTSKVAILIKEDGDYSINFFAKLGSDNQTARVVFACNNDLASYTSEVDVKGSNWKNYESSKTHFVKGDKAYIYVYVGGIIAEYINLDNLKVIKSI